MLVAHCIQKPLRSSVTSRRAQAGHSSIGAVATYALQRSRNASRYFCFGLFGSAMGFPGPDAGFFGTAMGFAGAILGDGGCHGSPPFVVMVQFTSLATIIRIRRRTIDRRSGSGLAAPRSGRIPSNGRAIELAVGFEPTTCCLQDSCSAN